MAETTEYTGTFLNDGTAKIQEMHEEYDVQIQELGLLSNNAVKVVLVGSVENINQVLEIVDDPRNPPIEPPEETEPEEIPK